MLTGYYHRPDATAETLRDGWYLTGDYGYLAGGEVYVTGRKKDLIITGGRNVYPQDIELLAGEIEGVHPGRVVAFGVFEEATGTEEVVLVAEVDAGAEDRLRIADISGAASRRVLLWHCARCTWSSAAGWSRPAAARSRAGPIGRSGGKKESRKNCGCLTAAEARV
jgi:acyl-CoA synthetase (AMP-forming)/AMP-acid ligase II